MTSTLDIYCPASVLIRESGNVVSNVAFGQVRTNGTAILKVRSWV